MSEPNDMERPVTKREIDERLARSPTTEWVKKAFDAWGASLEDRIIKRLSVELKRHTRVILESLQGQVSTIDDKYKDLPPRVKQLEAKAFAPKRRRSK